MKKLFFLMLTCVILLTACSQEPIESVQSASNQDFRTTEGTRSLSDALQIANDFFSQTESSTRSTRRVVESVEGISTSLTRSGDDMPALYLINYADDQGYALIGANEQAYGIYAISDKGHFAMTDTIGNEALSDFVSKAIYHAEAMSYAPTVQNDSLVIIGLQYQITDKVEPMLPYGAAYWHQNAPYNKYCYTTDKLFPQPVGCGPLCLAQLMSYYDEYVNRPYWVKYEGLNLNWNDFAYMGYNEDGTPDNDKELDNFAQCLKLLRTLLKGEMANGQFYTDSENFLGALTQIGYENAELFSDKPLKDVMNDVKTFMKSGISGYLRAPLIFYGVKSQGNDKGHFWVVDGYVERRHRNLTGYPLYVTDPILFHCIWGQQAGTSFNNGYYAYLTASDMIETQEYYPTGGKGETLANPYYELMVIGGYKRKNSNF